MKIALDAGHGIETYPLTKSKGVPGMAEFEFNSAVAGYAGKMLKEAGYEVILTQPLRGNSVSLKNRVETARKHKADLLISIHADYSNNSNISGYWAFYWHENDKGKQFADIWNEQAKKFFPHPSRGIRAGKQGLWCNFHMTREPHKWGIPAVLIEHGFMSSAKDLVLLKSEKFRKLAAHTILAAVKQILPESRPDWRVETGKKAVDSLAAKSLLHKPEQWQNNLLEPLPAWVVWEVLNRITS